MEGINAKIQGYREDRVKLRGYRGDWASFHGYTRDLLGFKCQGSNSRSFGFSSYQFLDQHSITHILALFFWVEKSYVLA